MLKRSARLLKEQFYKKFYNSHNHTFSIPGIQPTDLHPLTPRSHFNEENISRTFHAIELNNQYRLRSNLQHSSHRFPCYSLRLSMRCFTSNNSIYYVKTNQPLSLCSVREQIGSRKLYTDRWNLQVVRFCEKHNCYRSTQEPASQRCI